MKQSPDTKRLMEALDLLKETKGITIYKISKNIHYAPQSFSRIKSGGQNMPLAWIHKICETYGINKLFIFGGEQPILLPEGGENSIGKAKHFVNPAPPKLPLFEPGFTAAMKKSIGDHVVDPNFFVTIPAFSDCTFAYRVSGESMMPRYRSGDIVVCKKVKDKTQVVNGEPYVVITAEMSMVKYVDAHKDNNKLMMRNENSKFASTAISKKDILGLYLIKGAVEIS